jgi:hypothetical protein
MAALITALDSATGNVIISWTAPNDNAAVITEFSIEVLNQAGTTWIEENASCDGSEQQYLNRTDPSSGNTIEATTQCVIPMPTLTSSPFSLTRGSLIQVRGRAANSNGLSLASPTNT